LNAGKYDAAASGVGFARGLIFVAVVNSTPQYIVVRQLSQKSSCRDGFAVLDFAPCFFMGMEMPIANGESFATEIYTKVDHNALPTLALPWPGGVR
jgi:hypothetical protein